MAGSAAMLCLSSAWVSTPHSNHQRPCSIHWCEGSWVSVNCRSRYGRRTGCRRASVPLTRGNSRRRRPRATVENPRWWTCPSPRWREAWGSASWLPRWETVTSLFLGAADLFRFSGYCYAYCYEHSDMKFAWHHVLEHRGCQGEKQLLTCAKKMLQFTYVLLCI